MGKKVSSLGKTYLTLGFIFLYLPILILIIYSSTIIICVGHPWNERYGWRNFQGFAAGTFYL